MSVERPRRSLGRARARSAILVAVVLAMATSPTAHAAPGDLDPGFDADGKALTDLRGHDQAFAVATQTDGRVVVAGTTDTRGGDFVLVRYGADGSLDSSFGTGGVVTTDVGSSSPDIAFGVAVQPDGKIVAAGRSLSLTTFSYTLALVRYNADGSLDTGFGSGGKVLTQLRPGSSDEAYGIAIQPDGRIVVAGMSFLFGMGRGDFAVVRYNTDGTLDSSFGVGGKALTDFGSADDDLARSVAIQGDGKIVAAGHTRAGGGLDFALARYEANGSLDLGFGSGGKVQTDLAPGSVDDAFAIAAQPDGKLVVTGSLDNGPRDFATVRYNGDGSLDAGFGSGGKVLTDFGSGNVDGARGVAIQMDGRIVVVGLGAGGSFGLVRYGIDGSLDSSFGAGGKVLTSFGVGAFNQASAVAFDSEGKLVVAGISQLASRDFAVARYLTDPGDETAPVISAPNGITADATGPAGAVVVYEASATDDVDGPVAVTCLPASGSVFPIGTTTVDCTASDAAGNGASASFTVHVRGAEEQLEEVAADLHAVVAANPGTPLADKVEDALAEAQSALATLGRTPPDREAALGEIEGAAGDLEAAVKDGLLGVAEGTELLDRLAGAARLLALEAIAEARAQGGDAQKIAEAEQARADGDARRSSGQFKDAVAMYKDAASKVEGPSVHEDT